MVPTNVSNNNKIHNSLVNIYVGILKRLNIFLLLKISRWEKRKWIWQFYWLNIYISTEHKTTLNSSVTPVLTKGMIKPFQQRFTIDIYLFDTLTVTDLLTVKLKRSSERTKLSLVRWRIHICNVSEIFKFSC